MRAWNAAGIKSAVITGQTPGDERRKLLRRHRERDIQAIVSVGVLFEGTDMPWAEVAVILRPTLSRVVHLQSLGRVLRTSPGKERALIIDCPGNTLRLGSAAAPRTWTLDGLAEDETPGKAKTADGELLSIRQCPSCLAFHETGPNACPTCGEIWTRDRRVSAATTAELERLAEEEIARRQKALARERQREEAGAKTLAELVALGRRRGYAPGWAHARWKARQSRSTKS
ncbi:MAG: helicase-related protein [Amaricoccus sp.]